MEENSDNTISALGAFEDHKKIKKLIKEMLEELNEVTENIARQLVLRDDVELELQKLHSQIEESDVKFQLQKSVITEEWSKKVHVLQNAIDEERKNANDKIEQLESVLENLPVSVPLENHRAVFELATDEHASLSAEASSLKENLMEIKLEIKKCTSEKHFIFEHLKELEASLDETKTILKSKNEMIQSRKDALMELEAEKALLLNETSALKAGSANTNHGVNSLFSEVNDKRQTIAEKFESLCKKYTEIKKKLTEKDNENEKIKAENACLLRSRQEEEKVNEMQRGKLLDSYRKRIDELTKLVHSLELRPEAPEIITVSDKDLSQLDWIDAVVDKSRAETRKLRNELQEKSAQRLFESDQLYVAQLEIRTKKAQETKNKALIEELNKKLKMDRG